MITGIWYYPCGYCVNQMKYIIKKPAEKTRKFYAGVFLLRHEKYGYILFDTGYSKEIYDCGEKGTLYNKLNPTCVNRKDTIKEKLKADGIEADKIRYIVLSHLHPDHIGGLKDFPKARIVISKECMKEYHRRKLRDLIFEKLLPEDFEERVHKVRKFEQSVYTDVKRSYWEDIRRSLCGFDLFRDGSVFLLPFDGHAKGQVGLLVKTAEGEDDILLAADAAWGSEFLDRVSEMSIPARLVQNDYRMYVQNAALIKDLKESGMRVYFSHEPIREKVIL